MKFISTFIKGIVLGAANIVPGLSGGTMAVVLNIYDKIINNININGIKNNISFFLFLAAGMGSGIIIFSNIITFLFTHYEIFTINFFMGVILGSIPMIYNKCKTKKIDIISFIVFFSFLALVMIINSLPQNQPLSDYSLSNLNTNTMLILFASGVVSAFSMIIPGISGSFILLILGVYEAITKSIKNFNIPVLFIFGIGVLIGLFLGLKSIKFLLKKYPKKTYVAILALVISSVFSLFVPISINLNGFISLLCLFIGGFLSYNFAK